MIKMYVDLTTFTRAVSIFVQKDGSLVPEAKVASGRTSFEILKTAKEVDADEIILMGCEDYAIKLKEDIDKLTKIEYNNSMEKQIKTTLGGF